MKPILMLDSTEMADLTDITNPIFYNKEYTVNNFDEFILDRIPSQYRRDIESLLFKWKLSEYNVYNIALKTRLINPMDKYWIKLNDNETFDDMLKNVLSNDNMKYYSPSGNNIKFYAYHNGKFGIRKKRLSPLLYDNESEIICHRLAILLNVPSCPCIELDQDWIFSEYLYDFNKCDFNHVRMDIKDYNGDLYESLQKTYPNLKSDIERMILFDFITRQDDRHRSNIAVYNNKTLFYPLYDNGRSLFFEDREEFIEKAIKDPILYCTSFGDIGTYWDCVCKIPNPHHLLNLDIEYTELDGIFTNINMSQPRKELIKSWIIKSINLIKDNNSKSHRIKPFV